MTRKKRQFLPFSLIVFTRKKREGGGQQFKTIGLHFLGGKERKKKSPLMMAPFLWPFFGRESDDDPNFSHYSDLFCSLSLIDPTIAITCEEREKGLFEGRTVKGDSQQTGCFDRGRMLLRSIFSIVSWQPRIERAKTKDRSLSLSLPLSFFLFLESESDRKRERVCVCERERESVTLDEQSETQRASLSLL